jgi:release factor glutamine methyltransferase
VQIKTLFKNTVQRLEKAGIPEPELETSLLLAHILNIDKTALLLAGEEVLAVDQLEEFEKKISRRLQREPLAYITEEKEFWSLPFRVSRDVLIPRPETELLIEITLKRLFKSREDQKINILDLGTGSGIIAVVLALELPTAEVTAIDLSRNALKVAKHNAKRHKVAERINFINSDWFGGLSSKMKYDLVLANPPYIAKNLLDKPFGQTCESLQPEVGNYEPHLALDGGERGIHQINRIAKGLGKALKSGGWFLMEIGADQAEEVSDIFMGTALFDNMVIHNDYAGCARVFQARKV